MISSHQEFDLCLEKHAHNRFVAFVPHSSRGRAAEHLFTLCTDTLKIREDLQRLEAHALRKNPLLDDFHIQFGQMLFEAALGGDVGTLFAERLIAARSVGAGLRVRLRIHAGAPALMGLPWELLHDGQGFLVTRQETPLSRLPLGIAQRRNPPLHRRLRILAVISSPRNLPSHRKLESEREQEILLTAVDRLQQEGLLDLDFCENAQLDTIQDYLSERDYDILHFTGHGVFNGVEGWSEILLEDEKGNMKPVTDQDFTSLLQGYPSLRLVVLNACQSSRTANNNGYAWLARQLVKHGVPAVLSMPYQVADRHATPFAERFYTELTSNKPLDIALTEARSTLNSNPRQGSRSATTEDNPRGIDFATPVLFLNDPNSTHVAEVEPHLQEIPLNIPVEWDAVPVIAEGFVGRHEEMRSIRRSLTGRRQRAVVIHGLEGIGKSVLATRVACSLGKRFRGIKAMRLVPSTRPEDILSELNAFLDISGDNTFDPVLRSHQPLDIKVAELARILTRVPLLLIFDSVEDSLPKGRTAHAGGMSIETAHGPDGFADAALDAFFQQLIEGVAQGSRFIFTSRYDFDPARGQPKDEITHIHLGELPFPMAVQCMNNTKALGALPLMPSARAAGMQALPESEAQSITKRELYNRLGGHPYNIQLFSRRAALMGVTDVWFEIADVEREMIRFTLLDPIWAQLSPRARTLLLRASSLEESPTLGILQWIMGDEKDASPTVDAELNALLGWGLMIRQGRAHNEVVFIIPGPVRSYARQQFKQSAEDKVALAERARSFGVLEEVYAKMGEMIDAPEDDLLTEEPTAQNQPHTIANQEQETALEAQARIERDLTHHTQCGATHEMAVSLGQLGTLHQQQRNYRLALEKHVEALTLLEQLGSADAQTARDNLARLRVEMGIEAFAAAMAELDDDTEELPETGELPVEQILGFVVYNTLNVLTEDTQERQGWKETLEGLRLRAQMQSDEEFAAFLGAALEVVRGVDPNQVRVELKEPFAEVWRQLAEELEREQ